MSVSSESPLGTHYPQYSMRLLYKVTVLYSFVLYAVLSVLIAILPAQLPILGDIYEQQNILNNSILMALNGIKIPKINRFLPCFYLTYSLTVARYSVCIFEVFRGLWHTHFSPLDYSKIQKKK